MSKKKSHNKNKCKEADEEEESSTSSSSESKPEQEAHNLKRMKKHDAGRRKKRKQETSSDESSGSESSSSSTSSTSSSSDEKAASSEENKQTIQKKLEKQKLAPTPAPAPNQEHTSPERPQKRSIGASGGQQHKSKWDSPDERRRQRSKSRHRDRSKEHGRSRERDRPREWRDYRNGSGGRGGFRNYNNRDFGRRGDNRQDYRDREDARCRRGKSREGREDRSHPNERRDYNRSPRRERDNRVKREYSPRPAPQRRNRRNSRDNCEDGKSHEWGKKTNAKSGYNDTTKESTEKEKPNFGLSGALTEDTNKVNGVVIKYSEPPEARKPKRRWRLYPFKGETALPTLHIHRQSCFLIGRDRKVVDLAVDHPSCSKQHAALQYRLVPFEREDGTQGKRVRLYLIDLESANGTFLNNKTVDARKYYELMEKDVIKFGFSTREYVLLHENSKEDQEDDDVQVKQEPEDEPAREDP